MYGEIADYVHTYLVRKIPSPLPPPEGKHQYIKILMILLNNTGHDFSLYKENTIRRRIERRMDMHSIEDPDAYARYLAENPSEVRLLFKELLINVTSFFRDPEAFEVLKTEILPPLLIDKPENYVFRVWVAGCADRRGGLLHRHGPAGMHGYGPAPAQGPDLHTDINEDAIAVARGGVYPPNIAIDISPVTAQAVFYQGGDRVP